MARLRLLLFSVLLFWSNSLLGQNATSSDEFPEDEGFFDKFWENPGDYVYILIIFVAMGYFLWRVQRLGEDD